MATTSVAAVSAITVLAWFVQPHSFLTKVWIFVALVGAIACTVLVPYVIGFARYVRATMTAYSQIPQQINEVRTSTWIAVRTNLILGDYPIDILRLKLDQDFILFLLDVGSYLGVEENMQFEIVAVPDMEVYGVIRVFQVEEEKSWCVLEPTEGRPDFVDQMKERLKSGELAPPSGYEVRPFMAAAFQYVIQPALPSAPAAAPTFTIPPPLPDAYSTTEEASDDDDEWHAEDGTPLATHSEGEANSDE